MWRKERGAPGAAGRGRGSPQLPQRWRRAPRGGRRPRALAAQTCRCPSPATRRRGPWDRWAPGWWGQLRPRAEGRGVRRQRGTLQSTDWRRRAFSEAPPRCQQMSSPKVSFISETHAEAGSRGAAHGRPPSGARPRSLHPATPALSQTWICPNVLTTAQQGSEHVRGQISIALSTCGLGVCESMHVLASPKYIRRC